MAKEWRRVWQLVLFVSPGISCGLFDGFLNHRLVEVVAADGVGSRIGAAGAGGEDVLPAPVGGGFGVLAVEGCREVDAAEAVGDVLVVELTDVDEVVSESLAAGIGEEGGSVFVTLAVADGDVAEVEVDVLDSESEALEDAHPGAVEQHDDELDGAFEADEEGGDLVSRLRTVGSRLGWRARTMSSIHGGSNLRTSR